MSEPRPIPDAGALCPPARRCPRALLVTLPRAHRAALCLTFLFVLFFAVRGAALTLRPQGNDFTIYHDAARAILEQRSPLDVEMYIYLPVYAVAMIPFGLLPYSVAALLWALCSLVSLGYCALACARLLAQPGDRAWPWLVWSPTALCLRPIDSCFANGQVNLMIFAAVMLGLTALARGREQHGAGWLGLAAALKLVPAIFLGWLAARRRWQATVLGSGIALGLVLLVPLPFRGLQGARDDLRRWAHEVPGPFARGGEELHATWPRTPGQSLTGVIYRLATDDPARLVDRSLPLEPATPETLDRAQRAVRAASALLLALLFLPLLARPAPLGSAAWVRELALVASTALLVAPLVHKAHFVWLLLPFATAVQAALDERAPRIARFPSAVALALAAGLISGTAPALIGRSEATYLLVYSAIFWGALALHLWLAASVWRTALLR